jgi:hypothetical protein
VNEDEGRGTLLCSLLGVAEGLEASGLWSESPASWFLYAENRFRLQDVPLEIQKFDEAPIVGLPPS